jgi:hypothetical protein
MRSWRDVLGRPLLLFVGLLLGRLPGGAHAWAASSSSRHFRRTTTAAFAAATTTTTTSTAGGAHTKPRHSTNSNSAAPFVQQVADWLEEQAIGYVPVTGDDNRFPTPYDLWTILPHHNPSRSFLLHLLPAPTASSTPHPPRLTQQLTDVTAAINATVIHLHQDVWERKGALVRARLGTKCGTTQQHRIYARKTTVERIPAAFALPFLQAHHLWSGTPAKYYYGLFYTPKLAEASAAAPNETTNATQLVAVASFSARRRVQRGDVTHLSHELLRFCSRQHTTVVGGLTKLLKTFARAHTVDDVVTVVDRDWGTGVGWTQGGVGFTSVQVLPPLVMVVDGATASQRLQLVGAGITSLDDDDDDNDTNRTKAVHPDRRGLPRAVTEELARLADPVLATACLRQHGYYPVYDAGVERLVWFNPESAAAAARHGTTVTATSLWESSMPSYSQSYYSPNAGVQALLDDCRDSAVPVGWERARNNSAIVSWSSSLSSVDLADAAASLQSWRSAIKASATAMVLWEAPSTLDPTAQLQVRQLAGGWHTVGLRGGLVPSIYHGVYQVRTAAPPDDETPTTTTTTTTSGKIDPHALGPSDYLRSMAALVAVAVERQSSTRAATVRPLRFLHFGWGAGSLLRLLAHVYPASQHVAVELDATVVEAAHALGLVTTPGRCCLETGNALDYVRSASEEPFDVVCIDIFDGSNHLPADFCTTAFLEHLRDEVLVDGGCLVQNFHTNGRQHPEGRLNVQLREATAAMASVFSNCLSVASLDSSDHCGNTLVLASTCASMNPPDEPQGEDESSLYKAAAEHAQEGTKLRFDVTARVQNIQRLSTARVSNLEI